MSTKQSSDVLADVESVNRLTRNRMTMCTDPPYRNPIALSVISPAHTPSVDPTDLCDERYKLGNPSGDAVTHRHNVLSEAQFRQLETFMEDHQLLTDPDIEMLLVFKVLCGRWPMASEFNNLVRSIKHRTPKQQMFVHIATMEPLSNKDPPVGRHNNMFKDHRISHIIGFYGTVLLDVAKETHTLLVWVMKDGTIRVYTFAMSRKQARDRTTDAFRAINNIWKNYSPWPGSKSDKFSKKGLRANYKDSYVSAVKDPLEVLKLLNKDRLSKRKE